ncbi:hypothetical protein T4D_5462 [Trichinella pseudospiralis]|uniref:Uncharacterized protein n=1 Tax=Trichinella pseudospiralis TaxID=6337 RepID=A0A0V1G2I4_TRIPS|nr:hypothetical protein T4D_5462 [Trichinella pseudospiralis]
MLQRGRQQLISSCSDPKPQKENCLAAEVYDSLRHAALFTVKAKMLFQSLWTSGLTSMELLDGGVEKTIRNDDQ